MRETTLYSHIIVTVKEALMCTIFFYFFTRIFSNRLFKIKNADSIKPGRVIIKMLKNENGTATHREVFVAASEVVTISGMRLGLRAYCCINMGNFSRKYIHMDTESIRDGGITPYENGQWNKYNESFMFPIQLPVWIIGKLLPLCYNSWEIDRNYTVAEDGTL